MYGQCAEGASLCGRILLGKTGEQRAGFEDRDSAHELRRVLPAEGRSLFDERLHPAYFEDNDYERRCTFHGFAVRQSGIPVGHDNSSTLNAGYQSRNNETFFSNRQFYDAKVRGADMTTGWSLSRRRELTWD